jgi:hypothetical protein
MRVAGLPPYPEVLFAKEVEFQDDHAILSKRIFRWLVSLRPVAGTRFSYVVYVLAIVASTAGPEPVGGGRSALSDVQDFSNTPCSTTTPVFITLSRSAGMFTARLAPLTPYLAAYRAASLFCLLSILTLWTVARRRWGGRLSLARKLSGRVRPAFYLPFRAWWPCGPTWAKKFHGCDVLG